MALDKAIKHGKEHRKPYRDAKAVDKSCRNHGDCDWCKNNRLYKFKKDKLKGTGGYDEDYWRFNTNSER